MTESPTLLASRDSLASEVMELKIALNKANTVIAKATTLCYRTMREGIDPLNRDSTIRATFCQDTLLAILEGNPDD